MIRIILTISSILIATPALAQSATPSFNTWNCVAGADELFDIAFSQDGLRINNLSVGEATDFMSDAPQIQMSASAVNRSPDDIVLSIEMIGTSSVVADLPVFAISAKPSFGMVSAGKSEDISGNVFAQSGQIGEASNFCVRVVAKSR